MAAQTSCRPAKVWLRLRHPSCMHVNETSQEAEVQRYMHKEQLCWLLLVCRTLPKHAAFVALLCFALPPMGHVGCQGSAHVCDVGGPFQRNINVPDENAMGWAISIDVRCEQGSGWVATNSCTTSWMRYRQLSGGIPRCCSFESSCMTFVGDPVPVSRCYRKDLG